MLPRTMRERSQGLVLALAVTGTIALVAGAAVGLAGPAGGAPRASAPAVPHLNHVFVIVLENENADSTFGPHTPRPTSLTSPRQGAFLPNYYAIGHESLDNYIAMVSGQAPNTQTQADCQVYTNFKPGTPTSDGQYRGTGCVYPAPVATVANQLEAAGHTWKGYMDGMNGKAPPGADIRCRHPAINSQDDTQTAEVGDQYAARHNPFVYFHSIIDSPTCAQHDVELRAPEPRPAFGADDPQLLVHHPEPLPRRPRLAVRQRRARRPRDGGQVARANVPQILRSPAFGDRGLLIVTFDEAEGDGADADSSACCNEQPGPNLIPPDTPAALSPGPAAAGSAPSCVSPCIRPGTVDTTALQPLLAAALDRATIRHLPYLGYAGQQGLRRSAPRRSTGPAAELPQAATTR